jgi:hypothetical protein
MFMKWYTEHQVRFIHDQPYMLKYKFLDFEMTETCELPYFPHKQNFSLHKPKGSRKNSFPWSNNQSISGFYKPFNNNRLKTHSRKNWRIWIPHFRELFNLLVAIVTILQIYLTQKRKEKVEPLGISFAILTMAKIHKYKLRYANI